MEDQSILLFVYGTLMRGDVRSGAMQGQQFLSLAATAPRYGLFDCGDYPALVPLEEHGESIRGELWRVAADAVPRLDAVEGSDEGWFVRGPVELVDEHADLEVQAYFFGWSVENLPRLSGGWTRR